MATTTPSLMANATSTTKAAACRPGDEATQQMYHAIESLQAIYLVRSVMAANHHVKMKL
jgi:hypothetical protein